MLKVQEMHSGDPPCQVFRSSAQWHEECSLVHGDCKRGLALGHPFFHAAWLWKSSAVCHAVHLGKLGEIEQSMTVLAKLRNARSVFCQHFSRIVSHFRPG